MEVDPLPELWPNDEVLTAYSRYHSGPGWTNCLTYILIRDNVTQALRLETLQPEQLDYLAQHLKNPAVSIESPFTRAVENMLRGGGYNVTLEPRRGKSYQP